MRGARFVALAVAVVACSSPTRSTTVGPSGAPSPAFRGSELRQPAVFIRVEFASPTFSDHDRDALASEYEGTLTEALNAHAVLVRDVRRLGPKERLDHAAAAARAREVGADHAVFITARVSRDATGFCRDTRHAFRVMATTWRETAEIVRASDGAQQFAIDTPGIETTDLDPDCDDPRASTRRPPSATMADAIERLLARLLGG